MNKQQTIKKLIESADRRFGTNGTEVQFECPFCEELGHTVDGSYKLYLHFCENGKCDKCQTKGKDLRGYFVCGRCGTSGFLYGAGQAKPDASFISDWPDTIKRILSGKLICIKQSPVLPQTLPIVFGYASYEYLINRGLSEDDIAYYGIRLGVDKLSGRVVIPDLSKTGSWNYWVARDYSGRSKIRYMTAPSSEFSKQSQVFNLSRLESRRGFIVEGVFSSMRVGRDAAALYGKVATSWQIQAIANCVDEAYCTLDPDAEAQNLVVAEQLARAGVPKVYVVTLPAGGDPADYGREFVLDYACRAPLFHSTTALYSRIASL